MFIDMYGLVSQKIRLKVGQRVQELGTINKRVGVDFLMLAPPVVCILSLFVSSTNIFTYKLYTGIITNRAATISNIEMFPSVLSPEPASGIIRFREVRAHVLMIQVNH